MRIILALVVISFTIVILGCESDDERLARFAAQSVDQQARQNKDAAEQHLEIAKTARALVDADARSRADFAKLADGLLVERQELARQRDALEADRRAIASQRARDPVIAAAIGNVAVLGVCLLPLLVALYVLRSISSNAGDEAALNELLVQQVVLSELPLPPASSEQIDSPICITKTGPSGLS